MKTTLLLACVLGGCSVGGSYVIAPETLASIDALPPEAREHTAAPAHRVKDGRGADVRVSTFVRAGTRTRSDGQTVVPTRVPSRRLKLANALVWVGTPLSIAGLCMTIWGHDAVRWSGVAIAASAEPLMIAGTVIWVKTANRHPQELPRGLADIAYLPDPTAGR